VNAENREAGYSRRRFLAALGSGAGAVAGGGVLTQRQASAATQGVYAYGLTGAGSFTRLFDELPPFAGQSPKIEAALRELGRPGVFSTHEINCRPARCG
jgi:hypothetical protein